MAMEVTATSGDKIRCDACPVMCYIKPGAAGACDRYANHDGQLIRVDPHIVLERTVEHGGRVVPFIQDLNGGGCYCETVLGVQANGLMFFTPITQTASASCCTGGASFGFSDSAQPAVGNNLPVTGEVAFWYTIGATQL